MLIALSFVGSTSAQDTMRVKRIYLVDVTKSMIGEGKINGKYNATEDIFDMLKVDLASTLSSKSICDEDEIVIIPFTNKVFDKITGRGSDKFELADKVRNLTTKPGDTNIDDAWLAGVKELDSNKINLLFLMTDGIHNCGPDINELYKHLGEWNDNVYNLAFYFMLTQNAESDKIDSIAKTKITMETIHSSNIKINILQLHRGYSTNLRGKSRFNAEMPLLGGSCDPVELKHVKMSLDDNSYYSIEKYQVFTNKVLLTLKVKPDIKTLPITQNNTITFTWNDSKQVHWNSTTKQWDVIKDESSKTYILPKTVNIQIDNLGTRTMTIH